MKNSFYTTNELSELGLKKVGTNVLISRFARFYGVESIEVGSNVRIDDFCILSGRIKLGNFIHISAYNVLYGKEGIILNDFTGLSPRCTILSASDDFGGNFLISPMVPERYTNVRGGTILLKAYCQVGSGSIILPGVTLNEGVVVGAMSLVKSNLEEWAIYAGIPTRRIKERERGLLKFMQDF